MLADNCNASIINAGRGATLDLDALINAVNSGHIKSASLDVFENEPLPQDHPVWSTENILVTPHVAAVTQVKPAVQYVLDMIKQYEAGHPLDNVMNHTKGY